MPSRKDRSQTAVKAYRRWVHILHVKNLLRIACVAGMSLFLTGRSYSQTVIFDPSQAGSKRPSPLILGVNVHYGLNGLRGYFSGEKGEQQLREVGATSFRDVLPWPAYAFPTSGPVLVRAQRLLKFLVLTSAKPLIVLGLENKEISGGVPPISDAGLTTFKLYIAEAVKRLRPYDPIYEIWNEWNGGLRTGDRDPSDPRASVNYTRIAKAAVAQIRDAAPRAQILVGAVADDHGWDWTSAIVRQGALENADGLSVHIYNHCFKSSKKSATEIVSRLNELQDKLRPLRNGAETAIYLTEYGWPTYDRDGCGLAEPTPGYNFAQFILQSSAIPWLKGIWIYELKNSGVEFNNPEHNFGLFTYDDKPRPAVCFVREASDLIRDADDVDIRQPARDIFVARVRQGKSQKIVLWTSGLAVRARYSFITRPLSGKTMCRDEQTSGGFPRTIGPQPIIFDAGGAEIVSLDIESGPPAQ